MALVNLGAWTSGGPAGTPPPPSGPAAGTIAPPSATGQWTGGCGCPGCPPCTPEWEAAHRLPAVYGPPPAPTTAKWSLSPGQKPPAPGTGWQDAPPPLQPGQPSPAIAVITQPDPTLPFASGTPAPAPTPPSPTIFGLPPLVVVGAGGLLIFLIARRL